MKTSFQLLSKLLRMMFQLSPAKHNKGYMSNRDQLFTPPPFENHSPLTWYQAAAEQPNFIRDEAQARAIEYLDRLWTELMMFKRKRNRFLGRSLRSPST